jgi:Mce-associated membrane protein
MTEDENVTEPTDEPAERANPTPRPKPASPSPGAQAASRARRIGGRPTPGAGRRAAAPDPGPGAVSTAKTPTAKTSTANAPYGTVPGAAAPAKVGTATPPAARRPLPTWLAWLPAAVLAAVIVLVMVLGVIASHGVWWSKKSVDTAAQREQVLAGAKSCMAKINTYDYRKLDAAEQAGAACTTGALTAQYKTAMEKLIKPQAVKVKFTQAATINSAGIESISKDGKQWVVLIFGQLSTTDSQDGTTTPKLSIFSAQATMQQVKGAWLVSAYQYAPRT